MRHDPDLWKARSAGNLSDDDQACPYLETSSSWAAWWIGRAYGSGRVAASRGASTRAEVRGQERIFTCDDVRALATLPRHEPVVTYNICRNA